jgi:hypothetical protein
VPDSGLLVPDAVALAVALEHAAAAVARLAMALAGHPLAAAWAYRAMPPSSCRRAQPQSRVRPPRPLRHSGTDTFRRSSSTVGWAGKRRVAIIFGPRSRPQLVEALIGLRGGEVGRGSDSALLV